MRLLIENLISGFSNSFKPMIATLFRGLATEYTSYYKDDLRLSEEMDKANEGYIRCSLDNGTYLVSPEIKERLNSNGLFSEVLTTALSEIIYTVDTEIGKEKYIIEICIESDYEFPKWKYTLITIKTPITDSKYIIKIWKLLEKRVRKKIKNIYIDSEDINKISHNINLSIEILE